MAGVGTIQTGQYRLHDGIASGSAAGAMCRDRQFAQVPANQFLVALAGTAGEHRIGIAGSGQIRGCPVGSGIQPIPQLAVHELRILRVPGYCRELLEKQGIVGCEVMVPAGVVQARDASIALKLAIAVGESRIQKRGIAVALVDSQQAKCRCPLRIGCSRATGLPGECAVARSASYLLTDEPGGCVVANSIGVGQSGIAQHDRNENCCEHASAATH